MLCSLPGDSDSSQRYSIMSKSYVIRRCWYCTASASRTCAAIPARARLEENASASRSSSWLTHRFHFQARGYRVLPPLLPQYRIVSQWANKELSQTTVNVGDPGMTRTCDLRFRKPSLDFLSKVSTHERAHRAGWYAQGKTGRNRKHTIIATRTALTKCGSENWTS
jgi:hypothetical protein